MSIYRILFLAMLLITISVNANAESTIQTPVNSAFYGNLQGQLACTADCGNCCTGQMLSLSSQTTYAIGSSAVELEEFYSDSQSYWIRGYFYQATGSCDMGSCSFFHITSVDKQQYANYDADSQVLELAKVSVADKLYQATVAGPHQITQANEIVGQSADCSQGQICAEGFECVSYSGISGATFKSCEIPCINNKYCPEGKSCINIADGPQNICQSF